jgi:hypothetical protein
MLIAATDADADAQIGWIFFGAVIFPLGSRAFTQAFVAPVERALEAFCFVGRFFSFDIILRQEFHFGCPKKQELRPTRIANPETSS